MRGEPPLIFPAGVRRAPLSILGMGIGRAWYGLEIFWGVSVFAVGLRAGSQRSLRARMNSTMRMMAAPRKMKRSPRLNTTFLSFPYWMLK